MIEGSGSESGSIHLTNGSRSGSRRPKHMWIRWIRIRNTACYSLKINVMLRLWIRCFISDPELTLFKCNTRSLTNLNATRYFLNFGYFNLAWFQSCYPDPAGLRTDPDTDPDPAFFLNADPDPGFDDLNLEKIDSWKFNFYFLDQKLQFTFS